MRRERSACPTATPFRPKTTSVDHATHSSPSLLAASGPLTAPSRQVVISNTYIPTAKGLALLSVAINLYNRVVLAWQTSVPWHGQIVFDTNDKTFASGLGAA